ncbi:uncharacterized protein B0H18DRAFT_43502 [Fomitopsis serialis]|uniref:uncharacterized protein n=1 Tax=Fomitopsis serialis TaxID=139415 RepID=UPI002008C9B1|nr:uncharacterized protein B0H18DRAFT_43502 [Neoantrodia serialis]KAH9917186.1 hypothetical protein B0H18DRAFT_43502 [Neoantrodia serialis]
MPSPQHRAQVRRTMLRHPISSLLHDDNANGRRQQMGTRLTHGCALGELGHANQVVTRVAGSSRKSSRVAEMNASAAGRHFYASCSVFRLRSRAHFIRLCEGRLSCSVAAGGVALSVIIHLILTPLAGLLKYGPALLMRLRIKTTPLVVACLLQPLSCGVVTGPCFAGALVHVSDTEGQY